MLFDKMSDALRIMHRPHYPTSTPKDSASRDMLSLAESRNSDATGFQAERRKRNSALKAIKVRGLPVENSPSMKGLGIKGET